MTPPPPPFEYARDLEFSRFELIGLQETRTLKTRVLVMGTRVFAPLLVSGLIGSSMLSASCNRAHLEAQRAAIATAAAAAAAQDDAHPTPSSVDPSDGPTDEGAGDPVASSGIIPISSTSASLGQNASLNGYRPFPADNAWNQDVSAMAVDPDSDRYIASIGADEKLQGDFGTFWNGAPNGVPYVVVAGNQERVPVSFTYASESDAGPYPIPDNAPVEGGAASTSDRHVLVLDRDEAKLYELYDARPENGGWRAASGAIFDLKTGAERPAGRTSADAAGLPIFPGLVRYDEVMEIGEIRHALRFTAPRTQRAYVAPARHFASQFAEPALPPMGMRVRLKAGYDISWASGPARVILKALKKYGMILADNGSPWRVSGAPDARWPDSRIQDLKRVPGSAFEVVKLGALVK